MNKNGQINWFWVVVIAILVLLLVLSKIPSGVEYSIGTSDEHACYLTCENKFYIYTEGITFNQTFEHPLTGEMLQEEKVYNRCECRVSLLNKLTKWIFNN